MRILTVASEVPPVSSGVAKAVDRVAAGVRAAGHEVHLRSYADGRTWVRDEVRLSSVGIGLDSSLLDAADVVHLHGPAPTLSDVLLLRRRLGRFTTPVVYTHHFTVAGHRALLAPAYRGYDRLTRWLARTAAATVATTPSYARRLREAGAPAVAVIPWGVDAPNPRATPRDCSSGTLRVLVVGQMRRYKGHLIALAAVREVPELELTLAGSGELADAIEAAARTAPNVAVVQSPSDAELDALYRAHDVILLPSTNASEAFGLVLLEGMVRGCIPVASELPGVSDIAGPTGRCFPAGDVEALRSTLRALADDPARGAMSEASIVEGSSYSWDTTVESYLRLFDEVLRAARG